LAIKVGIVRDQRFLDHKTGLVHPESPSRLRSIYRMLDKDFPEKFIEIPPEPATLEQLELIHTPGYIRQILNTAGRDFTTLAPDTPVSANSYLAAWLAAGGCIKALEALLENECRACFCMVRPPGHHALKDRAGGFCIFNNLGIAARYAVKYKGIKRILIIDWDIHHGNAIQDAFYSDNQVMYLSSHYIGWFPHTGDWEETGEGIGKGYNVNVPVPKEMEDDDVIHIYRDILTPIVRKFKPELIFVAAGFDAHQRDPLGRTRLSEKAYYWLTQMVLQLSDATRGAPLLFSLEGGYDLWALVHSIKEVLNVLTFEGRRERIPLLKSKKAAQIVDKVQKIHSKYGVWIS
jgi:acetoin utilization deacetylase AcuC-like enzyme